MAAPFRMRSILARFTLVGVEEGTWPDVLRVEVRL
jgi:hypothetical protein